RRGRSGSWSPTPRFGRGTELSRRGKAPQPAFRGPRPRFPPARQPRVPRRAHVPREAVVLGFVRFPVDPSPDRRSEGGAHVGILLVHGAPVDLHVAVGTVLVRRHAVDHDPGIAEQVERLPRPPHHRDEQPPGPEVALARAHARGAVAADRAEHDELVAFEPRASQLPDLGARALELDPPHPSIVATDPERQRERRSSTLRVMRSTTGSPRPSTQSVTPTLRTDPPPGSSNAAITAWPSPSPAGCSGVVSPKPAIEHCSSSPGWCSYRVGCSCWAHRCAGAVARISRPSGAPSMPVGRGTPSGPVSNAHPSHSYATIASVPPNSSPSSRPVPANAQCAGRCAV